MDAEQRARAGRAVQARMTELALSVGQLARAASVSPNTVRNLIRGARWPHSGSRTMIEKALRWEPGRLAAIADAARTEGSSSLSSFSDRAIALEHLRRTRDDWAPDGALGAVSDRELALEWLRRSTSLLKGEKNRTAG